MERLDRSRFLRVAGGVAASACADWEALAWAAPPAGRLRELARVLDGDVVGRADARYAKARLTYDTRFDAVKPLAVAFCESAEDVARAIRWARKHDVRIAARSGGHSYGGYSTTGGLVVDVSRLAAVRYAAGTRIATIGAGATLMDVYARLWRHRRTIPGGSCPTVGLAGLALGGGVGFTSRKLGLTSDNILSLRIVTADGRIQDCGPEAHSDLYWACRGGGGGNLGVVTSFRFRTHAVGRVAYFVVSWPWVTLPPCCVRGRHGLLTRRTGSSRCSRSARLVGRPPPFAL